MTNLCIALMCPFGRIVSALMLICGGAIQVIERAWGHACRTVDSRRAFGTGRMAQLFNRPISTNSPTPLEIKQSDQLVQVSCGLLDAAVEDCASSRQHGHLKL